MQYQAFVTLLETAQIKVVHECRNWISFHRLEALFFLRRRVNSLTTELKRKDHFSIRMLERALDRDRLTLIVWMCIKLNGLGSSSIFLYVGVM